MNLIQPQPILPNFDDGGLAQRQVLRQVKERMEEKLFRRGHNSRGEQPKMVCGQCVTQGSKSPRSYRTWLLLRDHLIGHHGMDTRVVPE